VSWGVCRWRSGLGAEDAPGSYHTPMPPPVVYEICIKPGASLKGGAVFDLGWLSGDA